MASHWNSNYWFLLHILGYTYRERKADKYIQLIKLSKKVLPCPKCRAHFIGYFEENKLTADTINKEILIKWVIDYHNAVNITNNAQTYSEDAVYKFYHTDGVLTPNNERICTLLNQLNDHTKEKGGDQIAFIKFLRILKRIYPVNDIRKKLKKLSDKGINVKKMCDIIQEHQ
jgi:hypothetical protein